VVVSLKHRDLTGFVLAGGKSSRMGANKALLALQGRSLLENAMAILEQLCEKVCIIGSRQLYGAFGECYEDVYRDCGPLAGIHSALLHSQTTRSLITAVDTPFLGAEFLDYLISRAVGSAAMVTAPQVGGKVQPLCAVFLRDFLPLAEEALKAGHYKVEAVFPREGTLIIPEAELGRFEMAREMFDNLNTPEDFARAQQRSSGRHS
jgi:molybdenum cofactor guanylyltransferase